MYKILFVCSGNTCRSPMAEALFNKKVKEIEELKNDYIAASVGVFANLESGKASDTAIKVMKNNYNIDISLHKPMQLTENEIEEANLVLCMAETHVQYIRYKYGAIGDNKIYSFKQYIGLKGDVFDPYGGSLEKYINCAKEIYMYVDLLIEKLRRNKGGKV